MHNDSGRPGGLDFPHPAAILLLSVNDRRTALAFVQPNFAPGRARYGVYSCRAFFSLIAGWLGFGVWFGLVACATEPVGAPSPGPVVSARPVAQTVTQPVTEAATQPIGRVASPPRSARIRPFPGVAVVRSADGRAIVELEARVCLEEGWLEQIACSAGSREHESLLVPRAWPSQIHGALLMAGFEPGAPGRWTYEGDELTFVAPTGSALDVFVRYATAGGPVIEEPVRLWIRDHQGHHEFPDDPWVFAGSRIATPPPDVEGEEYFVADATGSVIGLVTFGDEVVGFSRVLADDAAVQPPEWEADDEAMPPVGTPVTIILRAPKP
jgi:hypothetical protein